MAPTGPAKPAAVRSEQVSAWQLGLHSADVRRVGAGAPQRAKKHERLNFAFFTETNQTKQKLIFPPAGRLSGFPWV